jgi:conjugal transfer/entry exclusion protein
MPQITLLLKHRRLDAADPSRYRPISNLNTISKVLVRLVPIRITSHIDCLGAVDCYKSAYQCGNSTETALLRVTNDVLEDFDAGQPTVLVALDLSAAFDCIDHSTLIDRLSLV